MLDYFNALGLNVYKLSFEGFYVARMLRFEKNSFGKFILLKDVGLMSFCYTFEDFMSLGNFDFTKFFFFFL